MGNRAPIAIPEEEQAAFIIFTERYTKIHPNLSTNCAARAWRKLTPEQKLEYAPPKRKKSTCGPCTKPKKKGCSKRISKPRKANIRPCKTKKPRAKSAGKNVGKCFDPGPLTNNGFLNFMREFRKTNCGLDPRNSLKKGAQAWSKLSKEEQRAYRRMGCAVTDSNRKKCSKLCRDIKKEKD